MGEARSEDVPLISVVMPVFNGARFLPQALDSVRAQTLTDFELVIIDDGSTDETGSIVKRAAAEDPRIRAHHEKHRGIVAALNHGCDLARARFIARMDADDVAEAQRLEKQVRFLQCHPEIGAIGTWARVVDERGLVFGMLRPDTEPSRLNAKLIKQNPFVHSSMMILTDLFRRAGGYRGAFEGAEDYDLWLRISEHAKLANIPELLMRYRRVSPSPSAASELKRLLAARLARISARERRAQRPDIFETFQSSAGLPALREVETLRPTANLYGLLARASDAPFSARDLCIFGRAGLNHAERNAAQFWLRDVLNKQKKWRIAAAAIFWMLYLHPARGVSMLWRGRVGK